MNESRTVAPRSAHAPSPVEPVAAAGRLDRAFICGDCRYASGTGTSAHCREPRERLGAHVQASDLTLAREVALRIRSGQVQINYPPWDPYAPFGIKAVLGFS